MPKSLTGLYLGTTTADDLRAMSERVGCSISDLGDLLIRRGLDQIPEATLRKWAESRESTRGRLRGGLTKKERLVLGAFEALLAEGDAWSFPATAIGARSGLRSMDTFSALQALRQRGQVVERPVEFPTMNRFGRPVQSIWTLVGTEKRVPPPEGGIGALGAIREAIREWISAGADDAAFWSDTVGVIRGELRAMADADPLIRGLAERDLVRATGLRMQEIAGSVESGI